MKKISKKDLETAVVAREKKGKQVIRRGIRWYNHRLKKVYSPSVAALTGTAETGGRERLQYRQMTSGGAA